MTEPSLVQAHPRMVELADPVNVQDICNEVFDMVCCLRETNSEDLQYKIRHTTFLPLLVDPTQGPVED